jgi:hypothetical protein
VSEKRAPARAPALAMPPLIGPPVSSAARTPAPRSPPSRALAAPSEAALSNPTAPPQQLGPPPHGRGRSAAAANSSKTAARAAPPRRRCRRPRRRGAAGHGPTARKATAVRVRASAQASGLKYTRVESPPPPPPTPPHGRAALATTRASMSALHRVACYCAARRRTARAGWRGMLVALAAHPVRPTRAGGRSAPRRRRARAAPYPDDSRARAQHRPPPAAPVTAHVAERELGRRAAVEPRA